MFKEIFGALSILSFALLFTTSCATTSNYSPLDDLLKDGVEVINFSDLIGETGVTFIATDGGWFNYLGVDGRKVVKLNKTGTVMELAWWINDAGQFCQQMFNREESCDNSIVIREINGFYSRYNKKDNKLGLPFTIIAGNPEGF